MPLSFGAFYVHDLLGFFSSEQPLVSLRFIIVSIVSALVVIANSNKNIVRVIVFNATFNNISAISWWSVLLVEEIGVPGENHRTAQIPDKLHHIMLYRVHLSRTGLELTTLT